MTSFSFAGAAVDHIWSQPFSFAPHHGQLYHRPREAAAGEMLARLIDPDARSGIVVWLIEVEGGPRMLAREDQLRPADGADVPLVVEG